MDSDLPEPSPKSIYLISFAVLFSAATTENRRFFTWNRKG